MVSWGTPVLRAPTEHECSTVAQRYLSHAVPSLHEEHRDFIVKVCAWDATKSRSAGDLDWTDDVQQWQCAEYAQFAAQHPQAPTTAAYALAQLALTRVTAWVVLTLSRAGPAGRLPERQADDTQTAVAHHAQAQQLELKRFTQKLSYAFSLALGGQWRQQPAAACLFERLCAQQRANKTRSFEDFHREVSGFMQDAFTLMVSACRHCTGQGIADRPTLAQEAHLPPFDLGCSCQVRWEHDWVREPDHSDTPNLDAAIARWVQSKDRGFSNHLLLIRQLAAFEEARFLDEGDA